MEDLLTSDLAMFTLIVGFFAPLVIAAVQNPAWSTRTKTLVTIVFCVFVGAATAYFSGFFSGKSAVSAILIVFVVSITTYQNFWQKMGVTQVIERETTLTPRHAADVSEEQEEPTLVQ